MLRTLAALALALALAATFVPPTAAQGVIGVDVTSGLMAERHIALTTANLQADRRVYIVGRCAIGSSTMSVQLSNMVLLADETWAIVDSPLLADITICVTGDLDHLARMMSRAY